MSPSIVVQAALFIGAVYAGARVLRALPAYRAKVHAPAWWLTLVMGVLAAALPLGVAYVGHGSLDVGKPRVSALTTLLLCTGLSVVVVGWRASPSRGRKRCPRCWYDMVGTTAATCPECGRVITRPSQLLRARVSRPMMALGCLLIATSYGVLKSRPIAAGNWRGALPATGLITALPWLPLQMHGWDEGTLRQRASAGELWPWQSWLLQRRAAFAFRRSKSSYVLMTAMFYLPQVGHPGGFNPDPSIKMGERAAVCLARRAADEAPQADLNVMFLSGHLPEKMSRGAQDAMLPHVRRALGSSNPSTAVAGAYLAIHLDAHFDLLSEDLSVRATDEEEAVRGEAMQALATMSRVNANAWISYQRLLESPDAKLRRTAIAHLSMCPPDKAAKRLRSALYDPDDMAAAIAVSAFLARGRPLECDEVNLIVELARDRLQVRSVFARDIPKGSCLTPELEHLLRTMLESGEYDDREAAIFAAFVVPVPPERLRDHLETVNRQDLTDVALSLLERMRATLRKDREK